MFIIDDIVGLSLHFGDCLAYGILIDFVVITISIGIFTGWIGFHIAALILCGIFHGIDADIALYFEPHESKRKLAKKKETFKSQQNIRYVRSASVNGLSFDFILVGLDYPPDADKYDLVNGLNDACTGACVLFGESPDDVIKNWEGLAHLCKAEGDYNKRKLFFNHLSSPDIKVYINNSYECRFKHDKLYFVREHRWEAKSISHSGMRTPENERKEERIIRLESKLSFYKQS